MSFQTVIVVLGLVFAMLGDAISADWTIQTLDSDGVVGEFSSIAVGSSGDVHISYYDRSEANLKYATNGSGVWVLSVLDIDHDAGRGSSIQLDQNGAVHISYFSNYFLWCMFPDRPIESQVQTKYATNKDGSWVYQVVWGPTTCTPSRVSGASTSLSIDREGSVHIVSDNPAWEDLVYSSNASGEWATQRPKPTWKRTQVSLYVDMSNNAHITYYFWGLGLVFLTNFSGSWGDEVIDSEIDNSPRVCCNWDTSLELDTQGIAHISYYDSVSGNLKYANNSTGAWITQTLDDAADVGRYSSLALDSGGHLHIAYYDAESKDLKYCTNASGTWITQTVDTEAGVGSHNSIVVDGAGVVHISYHDLDNGDLKYAQGNPDVDGHVDVSGDVGGAGGGGGCFLGYKGSPTALLFPTKSTWTVKGFEKSPDG
jgi:hypothetical protein